ncbi:MAG: 2-dehydropantoate 2-reductase [Hoeflea sp.]|uniref:2-dehydropantoate 2-reductase n=1 Tax=Hoeflea sp. TaxID=1940281 RepID=UPI0032F06E5E
MGAGAIGLYVGGMLAAFGATVAFAGRGRTLESLSRGLAVSRLGGFKAELKPHQYRAGGVMALAECDIILFCTKSGDTAQAASELSGVIRPGAAVISLQNGIGNVDTLRRCLPQCDVIPGTVPFNVVRMSPNAVHCAMDGQVLVGPGDASRRLAAAALNSPLTVAVRDDIEAVLWGKLLLNLNNGLNVLSGVPLRQQFEDPAYREVLALAMEELLGVLDAAGIQPVGATRTSPRLIPKILRLPTWLYRVVARHQLRMDESARSSSWDDLVAGREPETPFLNGAVCRLAEGHGMRAPVNRMILEEVDRAFAQAQSPRLAGRELLVLMRQLSQ